MELKDKRILVTGGNSFLGKSLVPLLKDNLAKPIIFSSKEYNLTKEKEVEELFNVSKPDIVIHLAVDCGGFKYKQNNFGTMFYNNTMMDALVQEYSLKSNVEKFVGIGTSAEYPALIDSPMKEENLWGGCPEDFNCSYGLVKRMMIIQSQAYRKQYGFNAIHLLPVNLYGPNYSEDSKSIRIIPILISEFLKAKSENKDYIKLSGTKNSSREFLYVEDCAEAILLATKDYDKPNPINIGSGQDIKMKDLAEKVRDVINFNGEIIWDSNDSPEQPCRVLDVTKAKNEFGFSAKTSLEEGLKKTIEWHIQNKKN